MSYNEGTPEQIQDTAEIRSVGLFGNAAVMSWWLDGLVVTAAKSCTRQQTLSSVKMFSCKLFFQILGLYL